MKIEKTKIVNFLKKVSMTDTSVIDETIFNFSEEGLKVAGRTKDNSTRVDGILKSSVFEDYNIIGKISVQQIPSIITILNNFDKNIEIIVEGNLLTFKENTKKASIELLDENVLQDIGDRRVLEFDEKVKIDSVELNKFITNVSMNKDFVINIKTEENKTLLYNDEGTFKFSVILDTPESKGLTKVKLGEPFKYAVANLKEDLELDLKTDFPIQITEKTEYSIVIVITAPRIDND
jgi:hypothetical protein